ncbi:PAS domain-containing protein [Actinoplanes sp. NEAU-A12]|uniref:Sensor-like histidine kinase SenX3 n=1 Tax=Actinoplanes sandaracinus TaxID=3045177 RepID=A0ABT6WWX7_9ACTN|nr:ATP-binding protein [Actinoplanes sandaracinus]MDI6104230.1 PAS domain-containing protein [Actinoplanes sandaracinus]
MVTTPAVSGHHSEGHITEVTQVLRYLFTRGAAPAAIRRALAAAVVAGSALGLLLIRRHGDRTTTAVTGGHVTVLGAFGLYALDVVIRADRARTAARNEAAASHNQLQKLIDNSESNIYMKRVDNGQYLLVNKSWERLFGVPRHRVVNLTDHGVFPAELADQLRANDLQVAAAGKSVQYEETADGVDGLRTYISVKFPVLDTAGRPYAVCGISTDITDRKRAEDEVRRLNASLETRVLHRTAELEASTKELDAFAYSVSHDLRAPLRSLHGFSDALLEDYGDVLDDVGKDYLHRLQRNVGRMGRMIDDLLNLSRATRAELERCEVDLSAMSQDVVADLRAVDPDRSVTLIVPDGLTAEADPHLLRLALQNLLANAWKFTGKRAEAIIEVGRAVHCGETFFFVRDNGVGFDMSYAGKLFDAFQRLHTTADFEGTGIGLAIVARVVRRHGGRIFAEAEIDQGATFYFNLMSGEKGKP